MKIDTDTEQSNVKQRCVPLQVSPQNEIDTDAERTHVKYRCVPLQASPRNEN